MPPKDAPTTTCSTCGAVYVDWEDYSGPAHSERACIGELSRRLERAEAEAAAFRQAIGERQGFHARCLEWRGVETACASCGGSGQRAYGSTSTWRGGGGGQSITQDVCDRCWGTGDEHRHGADLRELHARVDKAVAVEREACAEIASVHRQLDDSRHQVAVAIEGEIRARDVDDGGDLEAE